MTSNPGRSGTFGVLATVKEEGEGYRITLDDVEPADKDGEWGKRALITWKDFSKVKFDQLEFDEKELANFGFMVLVRLKAWINPRPPEVIDESAVRWMKDIELDVTRDGSKKKITLRISEPIKSDRHDEYICIVSLKGIFQSDKRIYGFDTAQARSLSIDFVRTIRQDYRVSLPNGQATTIEELLK